MDKTFTYFACFITGVFAPQDPITGSAHCALAHYWSSKMNKCDFLAYQVLSLCLFSYTLETNDVLYTISC